MAGIGCAALVAAGALPVAAGAAVRVDPAEPAHTRTLFDHALRSTKDARATFTQTQAGPLGEVVSRGTFAFLRPRRVRMEWTGKAAATAYVVEDTVWLDQPGQGAVVRGDARAMGVPAGLFVDRSLADLERACTVSVPRPLTVVLAPRGATAAWSGLTLTLDPVTGWPRSAVLRTTDGGTARIAFGPFRLDTGLKPRHFRPVFAPGRLVTGFGP